MNKFTIKDKKILNRLPSAKVAGFTILETLVAISILLLALTAPLVIVSQALRSSYFSRDQITAYYLAQEAIEYLRNKRDNQGLTSGATSADWTSLFKTDDGSNTSLINQTGSTNLKAYLVRSTSGYKMYSCPPGSANPSPCPSLNYNLQAFDSGSSAVLYGDEVSGEPSRFIREIIVTDPPAGTVVTTDHPEGIIEPDPGARELVVTVNVYWRLQDGSYTKGVSISEHMTNWQLEKEYAN